MIIQLVFDDPSLVSNYAEFDWLEVKVLKENYFLS